MKKLLPVLLCYVLMTSQVFAISGGPTFGTGTINPVGTYSGVITVTTVKQFVLNSDGSTTLDANGQAKFVVDNSTVSLGLFSLGVPTISVATGAFIQFVNGDVFTGHIVASVDPDSDAISGIVQGNSPYTITIVTSTTTTTETIDNGVAGKIAAKISGTRQGARSSGTVNGTANLIVNSGGNRVGGNGAQQGELVQNYALVCTVTGFRQTTAFNSVTSLGF